MEEVFPVLAGVVVGLVLHPLKSRVLRSILVLVDAAQVAIAAILTAMLVTAWRRRALRARS